MTSATVENSVNSSAGHSSSRGWLIVVVAFLADAVSLGARALFVVVILYWEEDFGWSISSLSQLMALTHICNGLSTPLSGFLIDRHPAHLCIAGGLAFLALSLALTAVMTATWQVWLVYGLMCGTAYGLLNLNVFSVAVMQHMPTHRHGLAVGIATSGSTFGQFALVPVFALVTRSWGWRVGYLALSALASSLIPPAFWLLRGVHSDGSQHDHVDDEENRDCDNKISHCDSDDSAEISSGYTDEVAQWGVTEVQMVELHVAREQNQEVNLQGSGHNEEDEQPPSNPDDCSALQLMSANFTNMWRSPQFGALTVAFFFCGVTTTGFVETHLVKLAVHNGFALITGSLAFSVLAACNGVSMVCSGYLADRLNRHFLLAFIFALRAAATSLLLSSPLRAGGLSSLFVFAVLFGAANYSVVPPVVSLVKTYLPGAVGLSMGMLLMFHSAGAALGASMGGALFQHYGSYDQAVVLCVALCILGALACVAMQTCGVGKQEKLFRGQKYKHVNAGNECGQGGRLQQSDSGDL